MDRTILSGNVPLLKIVQNAGRCRPKHYRGTSKFLRIAFYGLIQLYEHALYKTAMQQEL